MKRPTPDQFPPAPKPENETCYRHDCEATATRRYLAYTFGRVVRRVICDDDAHLPSGAEVGTIHVLAAPTTKGSTP